MDNSINDHETFWEGVKLASMAIATAVVANINQIISITFGILSIAYLLWKWRQDYLKIKKEKAK